MTTQQTNGHRRPSRDPDWRPTRPNGYWPLPPDQPMLVCGRCSCPIPATDRAQEVHNRHHEAVDAGLPR
jgi:hypothetical protein